MYVYVLIKANEQMCTRYFRMYNIAYLGASYANKGTSSLASVFECDIVVILHGG